MFSFAQGGVQGVHRAVAVGHLVPHFAVHADLHGRLGPPGFVFVGLDVHMIVDQIEVRPEGPVALFDEKIERSVGRLELIARVLLGDDLGQDRVHELRIVGDLVFRGQGHDVRPARKFADQDPPLVAHALRVDVLIAGGGPRHAADVHSTLVGESAAADKRLPRGEVHVHQLIDIARQFGKVSDRVGVDDRVTLLRAPSWP